MPIIKRNYWDKPIPIRDEKCAYTESKQIGNKLYFGESLKNKLGKKAAIITFKVIPVIALSILFAPVAIPLFATFNVYRNTGRRIREVHYNRKFRFIDAYIKPKNQSKSASSTIEPSTILPREVLKLVCQKEVENLHGRKAIKHLETLRLVSKEWKSISDEILIELINSSNIHLRHLPEIKTKKDAISYIEAHKNDLRTLNLLNSFDWNDADIGSILQICPKLEKLIVNFDRMTSAAFDDVIQFKNLKYLSIQKNSFPIDFNSLKQLTHLKTLNLNKTGVKDADIKTILASHPHLEGLGLLNENITDAALADITQLQNLKQLKLLGCKLLTDCSSIGNFPELQTLQLSGSIIFPPTLINLPELRRLSIKLAKDVQGKLPNLNHLTELETLQISLSGRQVKDLPSIDALTKLKELHLKGPFYNIRSLDTLVGLKKLSINNASMLVLPSLNRLILEELTIKNLGLLKNIPLLPDTLKKLDIRNGLLLSRPIVNHLKNLEQLIFKGNMFKLTRNYFDPLTQLKKLEFSNYINIPMNNFPSLDALTNLQVLRLPSIINPPSLMALENLKALEIHGNLPNLNAPHKLKLLSISEYNKKLSFNELKNLKGLVIFGHNRLDKNLFQDLESLEILSISGRSHGDLPHLNNQQNLKEIYIHSGVDIKNQLDNHAGLKKFLGYDAKKIDYNSYFDELVD